MRKSRGILNPARKKAFFWSFLCSILSPLSYILSHGQIFFNHRTVFFLIDPNSVQNIEIAIDNAIFPWYNDFIQLNRWSGDNGRRWLHRESDLLRFGQVHAMAFTPHGVIRAKWTAEGAVKCAFCAEYSATWSRVKRWGYACIPISARHCRESRWYRGNIFVLAEP